MCIKKISQRLTQYYALMRLDKPVGILLLLWPTLVGLWVAGNGQPPLHYVCIFIVGTILMRSAGCAINDIADRHIDHQVKRTKNRPLTSQQINVYEALLIAIFCALAAFVLIIPLNIFTKQLSIIAVLVAASYPYFKRFFALPQAYLGIAFSFGILMAFSALQNTLPAIAGLIFIAHLFWVVAYDTQYAMVDRDDDIIIGIKTSAITFGKYDVLAIMFCYAMFYALLLYIAWHLQLCTWFIVGIMCAIIFTIYLFTLFRTRERDACFQAFRQNHWIGAIIFAGLVLNYRV